MGIAYNAAIVRDNLVLCLDAANPKNYNLTEVEVLVVAGGGGGGGWGGGGGAGGLIYSSSHSITPGSAITATVGDGGSAGTTNYTSGGDGTNSVFGALTAIGGGGGGHYPGVSGRNGGSGGGGGGNEGSSVQPGGTGTSGQGFSGGTSNSRNDGNYWGAGGGGGASEVGKNAVGLQGGNGGNGLSFNISGTSQFYAGGGGGHTPNAPGTAITTVGGLGGGGAGGRYYQSITAVSGTSNTGGGGGGGYAGAAGGSGIIIVRYPGPQKAIGGTITSNNGYTIHTFTTSSTFTPLVATNNSAILGLSDFSGGGNFGTSVNGPTYSSTNGGSLSFDGVDDRIECAHNSTLNITSSITMESWIYPTAYKTTGGGGGMIITKLSYYLELAGSGVIRVYFYDLSSPGYHNGTVNVPLNSWSHVVGIRDLQNNSIKMYVNGILDREITSITGNIRSNSTPVTIGSYSGSSYEYTGRIANTKIYNRALTAAEIQQNYNALKSRFGLP